MKRVHRNQVAGGRGGRNRGHGGGILGGVGSASHRKEYTEEHRSVNLQLGANDVVERSPVEPDELPAIDIHSL
jgi:hypothetical protein